MQALLLLSTYVGYFLLFLLSVFLAFYVPGNVLLRKTKLSTFQSIVLSTVLGVALWIWQGFVFGYLQMRFLTYIYLFSFALFWLSRNYPSLKNKKITFAFKKLDVLMVFLVVVGVLIQLSSVITTGIPTSTGIFFCCGNISDSLYHIALTNQLVLNMPPYEPGMAGVIVHNYHYLSNLIVSELVRVFRLPLVMVQYQFMTIFISLFLGLTAISFAVSNNLPKRFTYWLLFFLYFSGDFIYLTLLLLGKGLSFQMGSLEDSSIFLVNPPRAFAIVMLFALASLLSLWTKNKSKGLGILIGIVAATIIGLKVYVGLFAMAGLGVFTLFYLIKKNYKVMYMALVAVIGSLLFYLPVNGKAGGMYFTQFWLFENFISQPKFDLIRLELARTVYKEHNNYLRVAQYEIMYMGIYFFSIFGIKLLGIFQTKKSLSTIPLPIHLFLITGLLLSAGIGFFFQQEAGGSNSFNFIVSIFIVLSIYAALAVSFWLHKFPKYLSIVLGVIIVLVTIPRIVNQVIANVDYISQKKGFEITNTQLDAFNYLKNNSQESDIVLVDTSFSEQDETTPFVSIYTNRPMFLSGKGILDSHMIETKARNEIKGNIVREDNHILIARKLKDNNIQFVLTSLYQPVMSTRSAGFLPLVYKNKSSRIYKVSNAKLDDFLRNFKQE